MAGAGAGVEEGVFEAVVDVDADAVNGSCCALTGAFVEVVAGVVVVEVEADVEVEVAVDVDVDVGGRSVRGIGVEAGDVELDMIPFSAVERALCSALYVAECI